MLVFINVFWYGSTLFLSFNMLIRIFVHTLTWDDVIVGGDSVTFIKHKKLPSIETLWKSLQILVDSTFQLVNLFTHILQVGRCTRIFSVGGKCCKHSAFGAKYILLYIIIKASFRSCFTFKKRPFFSSPLRQAGLLSSGGRQSRAHSGSLLCSTLTPSCLWTVRGSGRCSLGSS